MEGLEIHPVELRWDPVERGRLSRPLSNDGPTTRQELRLTPELLDPFSRHFWVTLVVAIACGGVIGLERQLRGKPAGVRTAMLICLSTALFVDLGRAVAAPGTDPTRVLAQVVTGVGFLGAGVMIAREGTVTGVTTAAVIWALAAIGVTIGLGYVPAAVVLSFVVVGILSGVEKLESGVKILTRGAYSRDE